MTDDGPDYDDYEVEKSLGNVNHYWLPAACLPVGAIPALPGRTVGAPPFIKGDVGAVGFRASCAAASPPLKSCFLTS